MEEGMKQFKLYEDTPSSVPELYLEILNLQLEMPDMARLEKPAKPPVPQVSIKTYYLKKSYCAGECLRDSVRSREILGD